MSFKDYDEFAELMQLPIRGKTYTIPECPAALGLAIVTVGAGGDDPLMEKMTRTELNRALLGAAYDEMVADGVPLAALGRASVAALADVQLGREMAEMVWEAGISPEALAAQVAAKAASLALTQSPNTGGETATPSPASSTGTTSPKGTPRTRSPRKAAASR